MSQPSPPSPSTKLRALTALNHHFIVDYPAEAARRIEQLPPAEMAALLSAEPAHVLGALWRHLALDASDELLPLLEDDILRHLLLELDPIDCSNLINRLEESARTRCLGLLPEAYVRELAELSDYPTDSAGQIMDARVLALREHATVSQALKRLRTQPERHIRNVFVVDAERHLTGTVDIQDLALAAGDEALQSLAQPVVTVVSPFDTGQDVADQFSRYRVEVLPVVDVNERLVGVIRQAALVKALQREAALDIQTMVGVSRSERALSPALFAVRKRLPWMEINLATAFLAAAVVGLFESTIAQVTALAVLLPVVAGQSGNAGAQAQAVTMRGLALREITVRNWLRVTLKEVTVGALNGVVIALTTAAGVWIWSRSLGLSLVIAVAMVLSMIAAGIAGAMIPMLLTRLGQDPAQSSSIILTTVTDVAGFMSFLGIATLLITLL